MHRQLELEVYLEKNTPNRTIKREVFSRNESLEEGIKLALLMAECSDR